MGRSAGRPTQSGSYAAYIELSDQDPPSQSWCSPRKAERQFFITINPGLQIVTNELPKNASVGAPYSATLDARVVTSLNPPTGTPATSATWSVVSGVGNGLPPGLALGNGVISGTPTAEGTYTFRVQATLRRRDSHPDLHAHGPAAARASRRPKPFATSPLPTAWEVGVPFSAKLTPSGGSGSYSFAIGSGSLPTGLALAADGTVSGTPRTAGVYQAILRLSDSEGRTFDYAANFAVAGRLAVDTLLLKAGKVGKLYRSRVTATGGVLPKAWRITRAAAQGHPLRSEARPAERHPDEDRALPADLPGVPTASRSSRRRRSASTFCRRARQHRPSGSGAARLTLVLSARSSSSSSLLCGADANASCASAFIDPRAGYPKHRGGVRLIDGLARHAQVAPAPPQVIADRSVCPG